MSIAFTPIFPSVVDALTDVDDGEALMYVGGEGKEEVDEFLLDHIMWCGTIAIFYGTDHNDGKFRGCTAFSYLTDKLVDIHLIYIYRERDAVGSQVTYQMRLGSFLQVRCLLQCRPP